jgi:2',3'-cyclic-nucleotide 2'-phosphodiesterase (5'-nucleotidase family)
MSAILFCFALIWGASRVILAKTTPKQITIIYTNDTLGTLQPCGCHGANSGGTPRRATYIKKVISENPNTIVVESGNLAFAVNPAEPTAQLEAVAQSLKAIGYTAVGVGPTDVFEFHKKYYEVMNRIGIPVVQVDGEEHPGAQPYIIKDLGGVKVGIVSFGAVPFDKRDSFVLTKKRYRTLSEVRSKCDVLVLLDQGKVATDEWLEKDAPRIGIPDIVVGGSSRTNLVEPKWIGKTMVVPTSVQGKYVGRVDVEIDGDNKKLSFYRQYIDPTTQEDPEVTKIVYDYVRSQAVRMNTVEIAPVNVVEPYFSYQSCSACHPNEVAHWKGTRHAGALRTLLAQQKAIPDCLPCHSDMYKRQRRLVVNAEQTGGVECIACHANVAPHRSEGKKSDIGPTKQQCAKCHTKEKSPGFDVETACEKIRHSSK